MQLKLVLCAFTLAVIGGGCGLPNELLHQPATPPANLVAKADLDGEWFYAATVVDIGYGSGVTFVGETLPELLLIRWDIQEHTLYARLAQDRVEGTGDGVAEAGEIVGAWAIEHVDWGEDEAPSWFERAQILVDWSENLVTNWHQLWRRQVTLEPVGYSPTDPSDPQGTA
jgi:hypothetical protein